MMTTLFISHSSRDDEFVNRLAEHLHNQNYKTWIDHRDTPDGMLWANVIQDGLEKGEYMLLVVTEQSIQSRHVRIEWQSFQGLVKPIILIILEEKADVPKLLQDYPTVNWSLTADFDHNVESLLKYLPKPIQPIETSINLPQTKKLNPNAAGLDELQQLAGEIDANTEPVVGQSDIKLVIPKSDVSIHYHIDRPMRVGRGSPHDVTKPDIDLNPYESIKTVSRNHATISMKNGKIIVTDTGSSNGTFIDGRRLQPNVDTPVESGTMVRFGALIVQIMHGV
jgi:hypothetical protein